MTLKEQFNTHRVELSREYERLQKIIQEARDKLLKTEGAILLLRQLENELPKEA